MSSLVNKQSRKEAKLQIVKWMNGTKEKWSTREFAPILWNHKNWKQNKTKQKFYCLEIHLPIPLVSSMFNFFVVCLFVCLFKSGISIFHNKPMIQQKDQKNQLKKWVKSVSKNGCWRLLFQLQKTLSIHVEIDAHTTHTHTHAHKRKHNTCNVHLLIHILIYIWYI